MDAQYPLSAIILYLGRFCLSLEFIYECHFHTREIRHIYANNSRLRLIAINCNNDIVSVWSVSNGYRLCNNELRRIIIVATMHFSNNRTAFRGYFKRYFALLRYHDRLLFYCMADNKEYRKFIFIACF